MKKGAFELSTNFIIGLILGILMFSLALVFVFRVLKSSELHEDILPNNFERLAKECIDNEKKLCLPESYQNAKIGETKTFGLVIYNNLGETKKFKPYVEFALAQLDNGNTLSTLNNFNKWTFENYREINLENNKDYILKIPFKVPPGTKKGTYVFNVNLCFNSNINPSEKCPSSYPSLYDTTEQIRINVI